MDYQTGWRYCHKCKGFFFAGIPAQETAGVCPADQNPHDASQSGPYLTRHNAESEPFIPASPPSPSGFSFSSSAQQGSWRYCHKCKGFFFAGIPAQETAGVCPADHKPHDTSQSGHYAAVFVDGGFFPAGGQPGWRFCHKCQGFFFAGIPATVIAGICPADQKPHDASQSGQYQLEFQLPPPPPLT